MKDCVIIGMALGFIAGALLVTSNNKVQAAVEKGKAVVKNKVKEIVE